MERVKQCAFPSCGKLISVKTRYCDAHKKYQLCAHRMCNRFVDGESRYCTEHKAEHSQDRHTQSSSERGYDSKWQKFAREFLLRHTDCALCGKPARCVDHKVPVDVMIEVLGTSTTYNDDDYQALCIGCNNKKGKHEDRYIRSLMNKEKNNDRNI